MTDRLGQDRRQISKLLPRRNSPARAPTSTKSTSGENQAQNTCRRPPTRRIQRERLQPDPTSTKFTGGKSPLLLRRTPPRRNSPVVKVLFFFFAQWSSAEPCRIHVCRSVEGRPHRRQQGFNRLRYLCLSLLGLEPASLSPAQRAIYIYML